MSEPRTKQNPTRAETPTGRFLVAQGVPEWQVADVEDEARGDRPRTGAGRAVQDDGLDVERLYRVISAMDPSDVEAGAWGPEADQRELCERIAAAYRAAPPLHDPQEPER